MAALISDLYARTFASRRPFSAVGLVMLVLAVVLGTPVPALAQWEQGDGQTFGGEKNYWGTLFSETSTTLCSPMRVVQYFILLAGGIMFVWLMFKGGRGDRRAWGLMAIIALVMTFALSPGWWLETLGLGNLFLLRFWARCGF